MDSSPCGGICARANRSQERAGWACLRLRVWYAFVYFTRYKSVISKRKRRAIYKQSGQINESVGEAKPLRIAKVRELFQSSLFGIQWVVGGRIRKQALLPITFLWLRLQWSCLLHSYPPLGTWLKVVIILQLKYQPR